MGKKMDRRDFLRIAGISSIGAIGGGFPLLGVAARGLEESPGRDAPGSKQKQWAMVIDIRKCLDNETLLDTCAEACHREHNVPEIEDPEEEVKWLWDEKYEKVFPDQAHDSAALKGERVLVLCNHCDNPPCVKVCPTQATLKREDGIVTQDMHRCIGCRYCMVACPYGARSFNWRDPRPDVERKWGTIRKEYPARDKGVVEKCNFCAKRIRKGGEPACVEASRQVPGGEGALTFGKLGDPKIEQILEEQDTICRRPGLGTGPNVYYIV